MRGRFADVGLRDAPRPADRLPGREAELAAVRAALKRARSGETVVVHLRGPAGVGKSALLRIAAADAKRDRQLWLAGRRDEAGTPGAAAEVVIGAAIQPDAPTPEVGRRLLARLDDERAGRQDLVVLLVDDAQWIDDASAGALSWTLRRSRGALLVVVAHRPGSSPAESLATADPDGTVTVELGPLPFAAVDRLIADTRGWTLPADRRNHVVAETGGVPLLLVAALRNAGSAEELGSETGSRTDILSWLGPVLDSVGPQARALLEAASILAEPAHYGVLADIASSVGLERERVEEGPVEALLDAGLLRQNRPDRLLVASPFLSRAVLRSVPEARRRVLHGRAATWTTGERQLEHRAAAAAGRDPVLVADLDRAADAARRAQRFGSAASLRLRARELEPDSDHADRFLLEAIIDLVAGQDLVGAGRLAVRADQVPDSALRSLALGLLHRERAQVGEAKSFLYDALRRSAGDAQAEARAALEIALLHVRLNEGELTVQVLSGRPAADDPQLAGDSLTTLALGRWEIGETEGALDLLDAAQIAPDGSGWEAELLAVRGLVNLYDGRLARCTADLDRAISLAHLWRPSTNSSRMYLIRSMARFALGDWDGADADATLARTIAEGQSERWSIPLARAICVDVPAVRGQWAIAFDHLERARASVVDELATSSVYTVVTHHEVLLHQARQDQEMLVRLLEPLTTPDRADELLVLQAYRWLVPAWIATCVAVDRIVDAERALALYERMVQLRPGGPSPDRLGFLRGLVEQAHGEVERARRHFEADLADPAVAETPFALAETHQAAGRLAHLASNTRGAARHLLAATDLYARLGATPYVQRCRQDAVALGLRSPSRPGDVLTAREDVVATLVQRGYTNKEVARQLFVTTKAVEYHLTRIYTKLGIRGRQDLRRL